MWMKIDDGLHAHRKTRAVTKGHPEKRRDSAPMGLWVLAGSWAARNNRDGWVPCDELDRWDDEWEALAKRLVFAGYWWPEQRDGEDGFGFNDWQEWNNPDDASVSGGFGNHVRWHVNKGVVKPDCDHCPVEPEPLDLAPDHRPESPPTRPDASPRLAPDSGGESPPESLRDHRPESLTRTRPDPTRPVPDHIASAPAERRDDVERLCDHLADRIEANGSKRPVIGKTWHDAARLMLDNDRRTEEEVHGAIEWCQADEFWRSNVLSMPKLREKFDQLRLQAQRNQRSGTPRQQAEADMWQRAYARAEARDGVSR